MTGLGWPVHSHLEPSPHYFCAKLQPCWLPDLLKTPKFFHPLLCCMFARPVPPTLGMAGFDPSFRSQMNYFLLRESFSGQLRSAVSQHPLTHPSKSFPLRPQCSLPSSNSMIHNSFVLFFFWFIAAEFFISCLVAWHVVGAHKILLHE